MQFWPKGDAQCRRVLAKADSANDAADLPEHGGENIPVQKSEVARREGWQEETRRDPLPR